ncbi:glycerate kinase [Microbacterium sp. bgisy207]|uniref:glycerate kinase n=1 Tax=Microbacterium sp. bgisy207 TaxID=3413800 RepID=UPI003EB82BAC
MRVLVAVDSYKGTLTSRDVATAIRSGWHSVRPDDEIDLLPLADGGEGTAEVIAASVPGSTWHTTAPVSGPDGRPVRGRWLALPGGIAVVDLASSSGLPLMHALDPLGATTRGLGETIRAAVASGAHEVWIGLGGSASTDAGFGALRALGLRALDASGREVPDGGAGLTALAQVDASALVPIPGGVTLLTDVTSPLIGENGAAAMFGPQKGASMEEVRLLDAALAHVANVLKQDPTQPGFGAAGGTGFGFAAMYGANIVSGIDHLSRLTNLDPRIAVAQLVITGEGAFDRQSIQGKLVGNVLERAARAGVSSAVIAGVIHEHPGVAHRSLTEQAGSSSAAMKDPARWAASAAASLAKSLDGVDVVKAI